MSAAVALAAVLSTGFFASGALAAQPPVGLGTADSYAVLGGSTVTNTGPSVLNGDLGVDPGSAITGFPPGIVNGVTHAADAAALQAQSDLTIAYDDAAGRNPPAAVPADLVGLTLTPGVYNSAGPLGLTGALTLDAQGDPNAVFVFQAGTTLITGTGSQMNLVNGAQPCNVFWQVGTSATLGTGSTFVGNILALATITLSDSVTVAGRTLARNGGVTLINDTITAAHCAAPPTGTPPTGTGVGGSNGTPAGGAPAGGTSPGGDAVPFPTGPTPGGTTTAETTTITSGRCRNQEFPVAVHGKRISRVVFSVASRVIATRTKAPFAVVVKRGGAKMYTVSARVSFTDRTRSVTRRVRFRACAAAQVRTPVSPARPPIHPPGFTG